VETPTRGLPLATAKHERVNARVEVGRKARRETVAAAQIDHMFKNTLRLHDIFRKSTWIYGIVRLIATQQ
jgi:hypothetical protein